METASLDEQLEWINELWGRTRDFFEWRDGTYCLKGTDHRANDVCDNPTLYASLPVNEREACMRLFWLQYVMKRWFNYELMNGPVYCFTVNRPEWGQ